MDKTKRVADVKSALITRHLSLGWEGRRANKQIDLNIILEIKNFEMRNITVECINFY